MFRLGQKERQLKNLLGSDQIIPGFSKYGSVLCILSRAEKIAKGFA
jgi:hypothetical protein